jgi:hypothetical protein
MADSLCRLSAVGNSRNVSSGKMVVALGAVDPRGIASASGRGDAFDFQGAIRMGEAVVHFCRRDFSAARIVGVFVGVAPSLKCLSARAGTILRSSIFNLVCAAAQL